MKFTAFALIAGLCLVAVTASADITMNKDLVEEDMKPTDFVSANALKCMIDEVIQLRNDTQTFIDDVRACGGVVTKNGQNLIDASNDIINTCRAILGVKESICEIVVVEDDTAAQTLGSVSGVKNTHKCFVKMLRKLQTLKKQIKYALELMKEIKQVPSDTSDCIVDAIIIFRSSLIQFPSNIKTCFNLQKLLKLLL